MILGVDSATFYQETTTQVAIITTIGVIIVALIGFFTAKLTAGARREIKSKSVEASESAGIAKDFAAALEAKNAFIDSLEERIQFLDDRLMRQSLRITELERREDEYREQQRAAAILERNYTRELDDLRALVDEIKRRESPPP